MYIHTTQDSRVGCISAIATPINCLFAMCLMKSGSGEFVVYTPKFLLTNLTYDQYLG